MKLYIIVIIIIKVTFHHFSRARQRRYQKAQYWKQVCCTTIWSTVCRRVRMCALFSPEILQAGAVKELWINPFTAPACKISGPEDWRTRLQTVYFPEDLLPMLYVLMKILLHASAKKKATRLQISHFYRSLSNDIMVVKGLKIWNIK